MSGLLDIRLAITIVLSLSLALPMISNSQGNQLYRYQNDKGVTVISSKIPAEYIRKGYDIITRSGRLVKTISPEPSAKEKIKLKKALLERKRLAKWDADLLRRYSHSDDIEEAKQRKLTQNWSDLNIIKRNIEKTKSEINRYQRSAAADEREGREVSLETLSIIEQLKRKQASEINTQKAILKKRNSIINKFNKDIKRFKIIRP